MGKPPKMSSWGVMRVHRSKSVQYARSKLTYYAHSLGITTNWFILSIFNNYYFVNTRITLRSPRITDMWIPSFIILNEYHAYVIGNTANIRRWSNADPTLNEHGQQWTFTEMTTMLYRLHFYGLNLIDWWFFSGFIWALNIYNNLIIVTHNLLLVVIQGSTRLF